MSQVLVTEDYLEDIADAIRGKNGSEDTYTPAQMAGAIEGIRTADEVVLVSKSVTANGSYNPASDSADGYSGVSVNVPNSYSASDNGKVVVNQALTAQTSKSINANGTYDTTLNNEVVVSVPAPTLVSKSITQNGTYNPTDDSADGYSSVTVNVSGGGTSKTQILNQGQVSDTSHYMSANFDSSVDFSDYNCLLFDLYRGGVKVGSSIIGEWQFGHNSTFTFYIYGGTYTYYMRLKVTDKTIECYQYSGSYVNLYVDVYGANIL